MNTFARLALIDVLQAVDSLKCLNEQTHKKHGYTAPLVLKQEELLLLQGAFVLMRRALDTMTPLVWDGLGVANASAPPAGSKPVLRLV